jgi:hypothetical protein
VSVDREIHETKDQAIKLLMLTLEDRLHGVLGIRGLEEDAVRTWKYAEPRGEELLAEKKDSDSLHGTSKGSRKSNWFSS